MASPYFTERFYCRHHCRNFRCGFTTSYEEDSDFARRCSKVNKTRIVVANKDVAITSTLLVAPEKNDIPTTSQFHSVTNFVQSGAKIAKELTTIS